MKQVIFDVETKKSFDDVGGYFPEKLEISFVGVIEREGFPETGVISESRYEFFEKDLDTLWPILEAADVVIGFNSDGFDLVTLIPYYSGDVRAFPSLDLLSRVKDAYGKRISLDAIAKETMGVQKSGHGLDAIKYYNNGEWDKLASYCMKDVEITRDIYDYGRTKGHVKFLNKWNTLQTVTVDFNFEIPEDAGLQMTLV